MKGRAWMWMSSWRARRVRKVFVHMPGIRRRFRLVLRDFGMPTLSFFFSFLLSSGLLFGMLFVLFLDLVRDGWMDCVGISLGGYMI